MESSPLDPAHTYCTCGESISLASKLPAPVWPRENKSPRNLYVKSIPLNTTFDERYHPHSASLSCYEDL